MAVPVAPKPFAVGENVIGPGDVLYLITAIRTNKNRTVITGVSSTITRIPGIPKLSSGAGGGGKTVTAPVKYFRRP
jgi:hypothetical protein